MSALWCGQGRQITGRRRCGDLLDPPRVAGEVIGKPASITSNAKAGELLRDLHLSGVFSEIPATARRNQRRSKMWTGLLLRFQWGSWPRLL